MSVLYSGALGTLASDGHVDALWYVLYKDRLAFFASFTEASLGNPPIDSIPLSTIEEINFSTEDPSNPLLTLTIEGELESPDDEEGMMESIFLIRLEEQDDLNRWSMELQKACEAMEQASQASSQKSTASKSKNKHRKSGKLSVFVDMAAESKKSLADAEYKAKLAEEVQNMHKLERNVTAQKLAGQEDEIEELHRQIEDLKLEKKRAMEARSDMLQAIDSNPSGGGGKPAMPSAASRFLLAMVKDKFQRHEDATRAQLDVERSRNFDLRHDFQDLQRQQAQVDQERFARDAQNERLQKLLDEEMELNGKLRTQIGEMRAQMDVLRKGNSALGDAELELELKASDAASLKTRLENAQSKAQHLESQVKILTTKLDQSEQDRNAMKDLAGANGDEVEKLRARTKADRAELDRLRRVEQDNEDLKGGSSSLEGQIEALRGQVKDREAELLRMKQALKKTDREGATAESVLRAENAALLQQKEDLRMQVAQLTTQNKDRDRTMEKLRAQIEDLRTQLQKSREELMDAREASHGLRKALAKAKEGASTGDALTLRGVEDMTAATSVEAQNLTWEVPDDFRAGLNSSLRLPLKVSNHLLERPKHHGVVGLDRHGVIVPRYGILYSDRLEYFMDPADVAKGTQPIFILETDELVGLEFEKSGLALKLKTRDQINSTLQVRSKSELLAWYKALLGTMKKGLQAEVAAANRAAAKAMHNSNRAVANDTSSGRADSPGTKARSLFPIQGGAKRNIWKMNHHKDGGQAEARLLREYPETLIVHASSLAGGHVNSEVADKVTGSRTFSPAREYDIASGDKITGDRVPAKDRSSLHWNKITLPSGGIPASVGSPRADPPVTPKVNKREISLSDAPGTRQSVAAKITGRPSQAKPLKIGHADVAEKITQSQGVSMHKRFGLER